VQHSLTTLVFIKMLIMKKIVLFAALVLTGALAFAQGTKVVNDKYAVKRSVQGYHGVVISSGIDLYLNQGGEEAVAVSSSDPEMRDRIITAVENGVLHIYIENRGWHWNWSGDKHLKAYVSCKMLDELRASGGSDVYIDGSIQSDKLEIHLSGGSDLHGKATVSDLTVDQSGGSDSYIGGSATRLHIHATGGSDFHGYDLATDNCQADASGGSDIYVTVNKELNAETSGGSDVHYKGNGVIRESHSSGSSSISKRD
jgi:Putative auto-transporter adhesin, head GIN domain